MIDRTKLTGAALITLAVALAGSAALADRSTRPGSGIGSAAAAPFDFSAVDADKDGKISAAEMDAFRAGQVGGLDSDGDGLISRDEISAMHQRAFAAVADARAKRLIERHDVDGDGKLSAAELLARPLPAGLFDRLDADKDGNVTAEEIAAAKVGKDRPRRAEGRPDRGERGRDSGLRHDREWRGHDRPGAKPGNKDRVPAND